MWILLYVSDYYSTNSGTSFWYTYNANGIDTPVSLPLSLSPSVSPSLSLARSRLAVCWRYGSVCQFLLLFRVCVDFKVKSENLCSIRGTILYNVRNMSSMIGLLAICMFLAVCKSMIFPSVRFVVSIKSISSIFRTLFFWLFGEWFSILFRICV